MIEFNYTVLEQLRKNFKYNIAGFPKTGLSKTDLSKISGVDDGIIWKLENGKNIPTIKTLCMLATALKVKNMGIFFKEVKTTPEPEEPESNQPENLEEVNEQGRLDQ